MNEDQFKTLTPEEERVIVPAELDNYTLVVLAQKETPIGNNSVERIESYVRNGGNAVFIVSGAGRVRFSKAAFRYR